MSVSRSAIAKQRTGRNVAFRRKLDAGAYAAAKARQRAAPINSAGAQAVARRAVRSALNSQLDHKWLPSAAVYQATFDDANTVCVDLTNISQGNADGQRIGDSIQLTNFIWRGTITPGSVDCFGRIILFQFHELDSGTSPTRTDVLTSTGGGVGTLTNWSHNKDSLDAKRLRILADWRFPIRVASSSDYNASVLFFRTKRLRKAVRYNLGTNYGTNKILMWFGSTAPTGGVTASKPYLAWQSEVHYTDA